MENNLEQTKTKKQIKNIILYATIAVLVVIGFLAIFMIFFEDIETILQILSTLAIIYVITLITSASFPKLSDPQIIKRSFTVAALILNLFWGIPWILIIWGCFKDYAIADLAWRFVWTFLASAVYCFLLASQLPLPHLGKSLERVKQAIPIVLISYLFFNILCYIWTIDLVSTGNLMIKLVCAELILLLLQWAIPEIILRSQQDGSEIKPLIGAKGLPTYWNPNQTPSKPQNPTSSQQPQESQTSEKSHDNDIENKASTKPNEKPDASDTSESNSKDK